MSVDTNRFNQELLAVGLNISGCDSSGNVTFASPDVNGIAPLVLAAHQQSLASAQCAALQAAVTSTQWTAYQAARKVTVAQQREALYKAQTDPMLLASFESTAGAQDVVINGQSYRCPSTAGLSAWQAAKDAIRATLPYPA